MPIVNSPRDREGDSGRSGATWDSSPQGVDHYKLNVLCPQLHTWVSLDISKAESTTFSDFAGARRVTVYSVVKELRERLSFFKFTDDEIIIHKCSAERPRGDQLHEDDTVYYLTWLIAWSKDDHEKFQQTSDEAKLTTTPLKWEYEEPHDTTNLMKVLVYIEQVNAWKDIYLVNKAAASNGKLFTDVNDLKCSILAGFAEITVDCGYTFVMKPQQLDVKLALGSNPVGDPLKGSTYVYEGKWYYVTADKMLKDLESERTNADDTQ